MKLENLTVVILALSILASSFVYAIVGNTVQIQTHGSIDYENIPQRKEYIFKHVAMGRGVLGIDGPYPLGNGYNRSQILYCRFQIFDNLSDTGELIPWASTGTTDVWSEGGCDYPHLIEHLDYVLNEGYVPVLALYIQNLEEVSQLGYKYFIGNLSKWLRTNYPGKYVIWEPCWEFNLYPWTDWWHTWVEMRTAMILPWDYEEAMTKIRVAIDDVGADNILLAAHIIPWHSESWNENGKLRINGSSGGSDNAGYLRGIQKCDVVGVSLYTWTEEWNNGTSSPTAGTHGTGTYYIDWLWEDIIMQIATDPDLPPFIGTFEYNIIDLSAQVSNVSLFIEHSFSKIPQYAEYIHMFGWWVPFINQAQVDTWKYWATVYDGYPS